MKYLVKDVFILDKKSPHYRKKVDFLVSNGEIKKVSENISTGDAKVVLGNRLVLTPALVDIHAQSGEFNNTEAETLASLIDCGIQGGFGFVCHQPSIHAPIETKVDVGFFKSLNPDKACQILPLGSITKKAHDQRLSEIMDMSESGALAFSTGTHQTLPADILSNALLYTKGFGGKLMVHPEKKELSQNGQVNQGITSVSMGYKGIPGEAETLAVYEAVKIAEFQNTEILLLNITLPASLDIINKANRSQKRIWTSCSSLHLYFNEADLINYDTNLKLCPPLRSEDQVKNLRAAVLKGDIDIVYSQHSPCTTEEKNIEFDLAQEGAINLQTSFLALLTILGKQNIERCVELHSTRPAEYLGIELSLFDEGFYGPYTIIDVENQTLFDEVSNKSKSKNSPWAGRSLDGKICGLIGNGHQHFFIP